MHIVSCILSRNSPSHVLFISFCFFPATYRATWNRTCIIYSCESSAYRSEATHALKNMGSLCCELWTQDDEGRSLGERGLRMEIGVSFCPR